jgi:NADH:ubiquinone oxidoreductase subunit K
MLAAAEAAVGLALVLALFRLRGSTETDASTELRG